MHTHTQQDTDLTHMRITQVAYNNIVTETEDLYFFRFISIRGKVLLNQSCRKDKSVGQAGVH